MRREAVGVSRLERDEAADVRKALSAAGIEFDEAPRASAGYGRSGVARGRPDFLILTPAPDGHCLAVELKRQKGGRVDDEQLKTLARYQRAGWHVAVCKGADEMLGWLRGHGCMV